MNTIIEKIRAEIERLKEEYYPGRNMTENIVQGAFNRLLSSLSALEKEEKPSTAEGLEEEIDKRWKEWLSEDKEQVDGVLPKSEFAFYARHFYELGRQSKEKQMMKEAVEGEIINAGYPTKIELNTFYPKFEHGQEVKAIIIK